MLAAVIPLPTPEITPPVTKIYLVWRAPAVLAVFVIVSPHFY